MTGDPVLSDELRERIVSSFEHRLRGQGSPILDSVEAREQLLAQVRSILDEVVDSHRAAENVDPISTSLSVKTGSNQAMDGMHLAESLRAACVLFETALPFVLRAFSVVRRPAAQAALILHRLVMSRIAAQAISYTRYMLKTLRDSHHAELALLARDLHDHAAHAISVAIHNLELYELHASQDVPQAQQKLHRAGEAMRQALQSIRYFSVELRTTVRPNELGQALRDYLTVNAESNVLTSVEVTGDAAMLPEQVCAEVYVTLREAIRNALVSLSR